MTEQTEQIVRLRGLLALIRVSAQADLTSGHNSQYVLLEKSFMEQIEHILRETEPKGIAIG